MAQVWCFFKKHAGFAVSWLRQFVAWIDEVRVLWIGTLTLFVCLAFGLRADCMERGIRLAGMCLQLAGFILVGLVMFGVLKQFNKAQPLQFLRGWMNRFPEYGARKVIVAAAGTAIASMTSSARGRTGPNLNAPLVDRIAELELKYASLFDEVGELGDRLVAHTRETQKQWPARVRSSMLRSIG